MINQEIFRSSVVPRHFAEKKDNTKFCRIVFNVNTIGIIVLKYHIFLEGKANKMCLFIKSRFNYVIMYFI